MNEKVLQKLLKGEYRSEVPAKKKAQKRPGRPKVPAEKKSRNFTLCLAPQYLEFLDKMTVKEPKVKGRGRKIRFIIERFIEHERRSLIQLRALKESLRQVQEELQALGPRVKKNEKLTLTPKEKVAITNVVDRVHLMMKILGHTPKSLHKLLPSEERAILAFAIDWKSSRGVVL